MNPDFVTPRFAKDHVIRDRLPALFELNGDYRVAYYVALVELGGGGDIV